jgi:hypothetical protein
MIRAPDSYVYPAPFNLIEVVFVAPFEYVVDSMTDEQARLISIMLGNSLVVR